MSRPGLILSPATLPASLRNRHECEVVATKLRQQATDLLAKMSSELVAHVQEVRRCGPVAWSPSHLCFTLRRACTLVPCELRNNG
jgi:hypothetical protein